MSALAHEVNFVGLVGLTHCYGGLSLGNLASIAHRGQVANPRRAALQVLDMMKFLDSLGIKQAVIPPHERPHIETLQKIGFTGTKESLLKRVIEEDPWLLPHVSSSAAMWTANAATFCPSIDSIDSHAHLTPANLATYFHRSIERETTTRILQAIFKNPVFFAHHMPLPASEIFRDEGSANHIRFCRRHEGPGVHLFSFGEIMKRTPFPTQKPRKYPARQTKEASEALARLHGLYPGHAVFAHQHPEAIDRGVFHNDVISTGNQNFFLVHEKAFWSQPEVLAELRAKVRAVCDTELNIVEVKETEIPLDDAISSYFFNSLILSLHDGSMTLIAPSTCQVNEKVARFIKNLTEDSDNPIGSAHFVELSESMENGGGPACLRFRAVLTKTELEEMNESVLFNERLYIRLSEYIKQHYPTELSLEDLGNPALYKANCKALNELAEILHLGLIYPFQRV